MTGTDDIGWLFENSDELLESRLTNGVSKAWDHYCYGDAGQDIYDTIPFSDEEKNRILDDAGKTYNMTYADAVASGNNIMSLERFGDKKRSRITALADSYLSHMYDSLPVEQKKKIYDKAFQTASDAVSPKIAAAGDNEDVTKYSNMFKNVFAKTKYSELIALCGNPVRDYIDNIRKVRDNRIAQERKLGSRPQRMIASFSQQDNDQLKDRIREIMDTENAASRDAYAEARKTGLDYQLAEKYAKRAGNAARRKAISQADDAVKAHFRGYNNDWHNNKRNAIKAGFDRLSRTEQDRITRLMNKASAQAKATARASGITDTRKIQYAGAAARDKVKLNEVRKILQAKGQWPPPMHRLQGSDSDYLIPLKEGLDQGTANALMEGYLVIRADAGTAM